MWKDKTDRVCRFCKEVFCCAKCRDCHVNKVHPSFKTDCCLCASEILPIRHGEFEKLSQKNEELLNHIVDKHLPLHCKLCGDLYKSKKDFESSGKCKWWSQHSLSPIGLGQKLKCFMNDYNGVGTPPEIYRKTSTPMFGCQKATFETPCVPHFSLKTPKTNSPFINVQESQNSGICGVTQYFSFSHISYEETTPFRTDKDEQLSRSNSGKKLNIMEEQDEITNSVNMTVNEMVDMDLTPLKSEPLELLISDVVCEESDRTPDIVKKVRFSDQHETVSEYEETMKTCAEIVLNASMEEKFHDARSISNTPNAKNPKDTSDIEDTTNVIQDVENIKDSQMENKKCSFIEPLQNSPIDSQIVQNDTKNTEKENQNAKINDENSSVVCPQNSNRVLITVLVESNSGGLSTDLIPLIDSGMKKLQEQLESTNRLSSVESNDVVNLPNKSVTKLDVTMDHRQIVPASSFMRNVRDTKNGFFAVVIQAMKHALNSFSGLRIPASTQVIQQREVIEESTSTSLEKSVNVASSSRADSILRPNKRNRQIAEISSRVDSIAVEVQNPRKRHKGWYTMIRARDPIRRMRNRYTARSSREVQIFSQGSLTMGNAVLPLPTRAHQSTQTE